MGALPFSLEARSLTVHWLAGVEGMSAEHQDLAAASAIVARSVAPHVRDAGRGWGSDAISNLIASGGPPALAALRADQAFVDALLVKAHHQATYALRLSRLADRLGAIIADFEARRPPS